MEQRAFRLTLLKNLIYTLLVLLCYIVQETPGLVSLGDIRPTLVIGAVVALAMTEGEFAGGLFGLFGGLLCDTAAFHLFGTASMLFLILGCACGLLIIYLVQPNLRSALLLAFLCALTYRLAAHYLIYGLWGYEGGGWLVFTRAIPGAMLSALWGAALFRLVWYIHDRFAEALE